MQTVDGGVSPCLVVFSTTRNIEYRRVVTERDPSIPFGNPPGFHGPPFARNSSMFCVSETLFYRKTPQVHRHLIYTDSSLRLMEEP